MSEQAVALGAWIAFGELAGPVLLAMLVLGLGVGVVQTATQIREQSIAFVVKLAAVAIITSLAGRLMMGGIESFATRLIISLPGLVHG